MKILYCLNIFKIKKYERLDGVVGVWHIYAFEVTTKPNVLENDINSNFVNNLKIFANNFWMKYKENIIDMGQIHVAPTFWSAYISIGVSVVFQINWSGVRSTFVDVSSTLVKVKAI